MPGAHSMSGMASTFSTDTRVTLWFDQWTTATPWTYLLTMIFLLFLGMFHRFLGAVKSQLERRWKERGYHEERDAKAVRGERSATGTIRGHVLRWSRALQPQVVRLVDPDLEQETQRLSPSSSQTFAEQESEKQPSSMTKKFWVASAPWSIKKDGIGAAIEFMRALIGYILMLAVMTYNVGFLFAVTGSVLLGELVFRRYTQGAPGAQEGGCS
ncbi:hypothetical protein M501DRAFT_1000984 [Patellaria atrata CBS 101060]|uniref:Copper transport protein n=1 Tax=Patellaria atrata CBS 101060 TaxID=1346257 RepID=A0A9P4SFR3_9PEZI|nr:hypothetical protein M501DRAFT_1000984 [Patellaria atrata CBS 101060]